MLFHLREPEVPQQNRVSPPRHLATIAAAAAAGSATVAEDRKPRGNLAPPAGPAGPPSRPGCRWGWDRTSAGPIYVVSVLGSTIPVWTYGSSQLT